MTIIKNIKEIIDNANLEELIELKNYLQLNYDELLSEINKKISILNEKNRVCAVCGRSISEVEEPFELVFGKRGFRKRAFFCGEDCLLFFLNNYSTKKLKKSYVQKKVYF